MSHRDASGFSLLEIQVGLLLLTLVIVGFGNLVGAQESLVHDLESWCKDDPVLRVVPPADPHERVARVPADLVEELAPPPPLLDFADEQKGGDTADEEDWPHRLEVTEVTRELHPQRARAVVKVKKN